MADFFAAAADSRPGLALFLNAGDPPLDELADVVEMLDDKGVDCLELAVPFPDSVTDGAVVRRSAERALRAGTTPEGVLACIAGVRPRLRTLRIAVLADWRSTAHPFGLARFVKAVRQSGADALLLHAAPPHVRGAYYEQAGAAGLPVVTTCYPTSSPEVLAEATEHAGAYLYLVASSGRTGTAPSGGYGQLAAPLARLRRATTTSIAVGFGVSSGREVAQLHELGADAVVVGSAAVARLEAARSSGADPVAHLATFVDGLAEPPPHPPGDGR